MEVELAKQLDELYVVFGLRCLSVLRYLTDHIGVLSLGVLARSFSKFAQRFPLSSDMFKTITIDDQAMVCSKLFFETLNILSTVFIPSDSLRNRFCVQNFQKEIQFINFSHLTRFVRVHDLPGLLAAALQNQPWRRNG